MNKIATELDCDERKIVVLKSVNPLSTFPVKTAKLNATLLKERKLLQKLRECEKEAKNL